MTETEHNQFPNGRFAAPGPAKTSSPSRGKAVTQDGGIAVAGVPESATTLESFLTPDEAAEFHACEDIIRRGLKTYVEVGTALMTIREHRLYRAEHSTFEKYCQARWEMTARSAHRLCAAFEISRNLAGIGPSGLAGNPAFLMPANEAQIRPLSLLPPEHQRAAWREVLDTACDGHVTARHVEAVVARWRVKLGIQLDSDRNTVQKDSVPSPAGPDAPAKPPVDVPDLSTREEQLRDATNEALRSIRELKAKIGAPDSVASADIAIAEEKLETFLGHLGRVTELQEARL